jgi:hypothetical protein
MAGAEAPPVILWAVGPVRLFVDGAAAFSAPEDPKALPVGQHTLKAEAPGQAPLTTRFLVEPFTPAFFHVEADAEAGLTLARLGTVCTSCEAPVAVVELSYEKSAEPASALLTQAAQALRADDWRTAAAKLRQVPARQRGLPLFHRLAAGVYEATSQPERARDELLAIDAAGSNDLRALMGRLEALQKVERARAQQVATARWNKVTERFARLVDKFARVVPGPVASSTARMAELSKAFTEANRLGEVEGQQAALSAAEEALGTFAAQLRASRPLDCPFQADVVQTLAR